MQLTTVTIPYKTYDYLNLGRTVLGLTNSRELNEILVSTGHLAAPVDDINAIVANLLSFTRNYQDINQKQHPSPFDPEKAILDLITI